jgi:hypothetical protein
MTTTKLIIAALLVPALVLMALVCTAAAVVHVLASHR